MNRKLARLTAGFTLTMAALLTTAAVTAPVSAHAQTAAGSVPGDAPLPSYPGLPAGGDSAPDIRPAVSTTPVPCADNGTHKSTTRSQALARAQSWLSVGGVPYSQSRCYRNQYGDYRTDCSGFVAMAWGVGRSGSAYWTGNLLDVSGVIARSALQPGDALLRHTGDQDENHVALFVRWADQAHTQPVVIEQTGSSNTIQRTWSQSYAGLYTPVRYDHIVNDGPPNLGVLDFLLSDNPTSNVSTRPTVSYGNSPMVPIVGDWDGNGTDSPSAYDPTTGTFFVSNNPETGQAQYTFRYGNPDARPVVGDWDGDGKDNIGVRMGNTFYLRTSPVTSGTETTTAIAFGDNSDIPLAGDWNGDGIDTVAVYRPGNARFYLRASNTDPAEVTTIVFYGNPNAHPLTGDWNGDGKDNIGVRMGNVFYFRTSETDNPAEVTAAVAYGNGTTEIPVVGDWNGDRRATQGIVA